MSATRAAENSYVSSSSLRKLGPGACDACRKSKRACDGKSPCATCVTRGYECSYNELRKREVSSKGGACDACRQTKRACDGQMPCSTCVKRNKACCYSETQKKLPAAAGLLQNAGGSVETLVNSFCFQWGSLFGQMEQVPEQRGQVYRMAMSAMMAQLSRVTGDAASCTRHSDDAAAFAEKCVDELSPQCAESFALLAWNNLNQDMDYAYQCARVAETIVLRGRGEQEKKRKLEMMMMEDSSLSLSLSSSSAAAAAVESSAASLGAPSSPSSSSVSSASSSQNWSGTAAVILLMRLLSDEQVLGVGDVEGVATALARGIHSVEMGALTAAFVRHLWVAVSVLPSLRSAILSASAFGHAEALVDLAREGSSSSSSSSSSPLLAGLLAAGVSETMAGFFSNNNAGASSSSSSVSCNHSNPSAALCQLRALAQEVARRHLVVLDTWGASTAGIKNKRAASADPFLLLTASIQSLIETIFGNETAASTCLEKSWGAFVQTEDDVVDICQHSPLGVKALAIACAAAVKCGLGASILPFAEPALRRLQSIIPDVCTGNQFISQYFCSTPVLPFWNEEFQRQQQQQQEEDDGNNNNGSSSRNLWDSIIFAPEFQQQQGGNTTTTTTSSYSSSSTTTTSNQQQQQYSSYSSSAAQQYQQQLQQLCFGSETITLPSMGGVVGGLAGYDSCYSAARSDVNLLLPVKYDSSSSNILPSIHTICGNISSSSSENNNLRENGGPASKRARKSDMSISSSETLLVEVDAEFSSGSDGEGEDRKRTVKGTSSPAKRARISKQRIDRRDSAQVARPKLVISSPKNGTSTNNAAAGVAVLPSVNTTTTTETAPAPAPAADDVDLFFGSDSMSLFTTNDDEFSPSSSCTTCDDDWSHVDCESVGSTETLSLLMLGEDGNNNNNNNTTDSSNNNNTKLSDVVLPPPLLLSAPSFVDAWLSF